MTVIASGMDGRLSGWSVTFLRLPGASGESSFTPLFDIVKPTTTEGFPALFTGSGDLKMQNLRPNWERVTSYP